MLPFVGPSYELALRKADVQRAVNMYLVAAETPAKAAFYMDSVPGRRLFANPGFGEQRGACFAAGRCFFVAGSKLIELFSDGTMTARGTLATSSGAVDMTYGISQLVVVDGPNGYVFDLTANAFSTISSPGFYGSERVAFIDNYFVAIQPGTQQFGISALNNAKQWDALDFASAESSPDDLVSLVAYHNELLLLGELTGEVWVNSGGAEFPFVRTENVSIEVGCIAAQSLQKVDSTVIFLGRDVNGAGMVYLMAGYTPKRISTQAVEQAIQSADMENARAWVYQDRGQTFYCLCVPGAASTWCYELSTGQWHERCDLDSYGQFKASPVTCHVYAFGRHLVGCEDGGVYEMRKDVYRNGEQPLKRSRISPHNARPSLSRVAYHSFILDCETGVAPVGVTPTAELSWSNDSGATWTAPNMRSTGLTGERLESVTWERLGMSRDRVWRLDFSSNAHFSIINAETTATVGSMTVPA